MGIKSQNRVVAHEVQNTILTLQDRVKVGSATYESLNAFLDRQNIHEGTYYIENENREIVAASNLEGFDLNNTSMRVQDIVSSDILSRENDPGIFNPYYIVTSPIGDTSFILHYYKFKLEMYYKVLIYLFAMSLILLLLIKMKALIRTLERSNHELSYLATIDPMTKLYNRRYFLDISEQIHSLSQRKDHKLSIALLDIDNFKQINDTYGHQTGDSVIITLAEKLQKCTRKSDVLCRFGGEEFIILLPDTPIEDALTLSESIRKEVEHLLIQTEDKTKVRITVSIGVSEVCQNETDISNAIARADNALYKAKNSGKNKVCSL